MARYVAKIGGVGTLRLQLDPPLAGGLGYLLEWNATSDISTGSAAFPLFRVATPFSAADIARITAVPAYSLGVGAPAPRCTVYTNFDLGDTGIATPAYQTPPITAHWIARSRADAPVVGLGGAHRLTATSDGRHTWTGAFIWEEV